MLEILITLLAKQEINNKYHNHVIGKYCTTIKKQIDRGLNSTFHDKITHKIWSHTRSISSKKEVFLTDLIRENRTYFEKKYDSSNWWSVRFYFEKTSCIKK